MGIKESLTYERTLFPAPATIRDFQSLQRRKRWALTDVSHEPIEGTPRSRTPSIPRTSRPERTMLQIPGGVICKRCYGSSKGLAVIANFVYSSPTRRLQDNLSDSKTSQHSKRTDALTCSSRLRLAVTFLMLWSDTKFLHCGLQNIPRASRTQSIDALPSKRKKKHTQYQVTS